MGKPLLRQWSTWAAITIIVGVPLCIEYRHFSPILNVLPISISSVMAYISDEKWLLMAKFLFSKTSRKLTMSLITDFESAAVRIAQAGEAAAKPHLEAAATAAASAMEEQAKTEASALPAPYGLIAQSILAELPTLSGSAIAALFKGIGSLVSSAKAEAPETPLGTTHTGE